MVWFKTDDAFYSHPKVLSIPRSIRAEAVGCWTLAGAWSANHLTDGAIPAFMLDELAVSIDAARALVTARLWAETADGFCFRSWAEYQPTRAEVEAAREAERVRKADYRARRKRGSGGQWEPSDPDPDGTPEPVPAESRRDTPGTPDGTPAGVPPYPTRPDPTRPDHEEPPMSDLRPDEPGSTGSELALIGSPEPVEPEKPEGYPASFEAWWICYPRHEGKRKALKAWREACRRASPKAVLDGAIRYRDDPNRTPQFTAHATTWLNRDGWEDAPLPARRPETQQARLEGSRAETLASLERMGVA